MKYFQAPLASRVTQLAVIDSLFVSIAVGRKSLTISQLHKIGGQLMEHRVT